MRKPLSLFGRALVLALVSGNIYLPQLQSAGICVRASFMPVLRPFVASAVTGFGLSQVPVHILLTWKHNESLVHRIPCHLVESTLGDRARSRQTALED